MDEDSPGSGIVGGVKIEKRKYRRTLGEDGKPKKNFYNPPGKVIRQCAQQTYYDNFYGNQGNYHSLKTKYKTQMCIHFLNKGNCQLGNSCLYAHGPNELRQPTDPLPDNFGKTALGAVHSNYKTMKCKNFYQTGECKFGDGCSFFHCDKEQRNLTDPLPNLPEGVTLPPNVEKLKNFREKKSQNMGYNNQMNNYHQQYQQIPGPMFQISNLTDIMALGGFNPNKYSNPMPQPMQFNGYGYNYGQVPPHMMQQPMQPMSNYGSPQPFNGQVQPPQGTIVGSQQKQPTKKSNSQGQNKNAEKKEKKTKNAEKKYVTKPSVSPVAQAKEEIASEQPK